MSGVHVYTPHPSNYPLPQQAQTGGNYDYAFFQPLGQPSPFTPNISLFGTPSPYRSNTPLPGSPRQVRWADEQTFASDDDPALNDNLNWEGNWATRARRPSFNGTISAGPYTAAQTFLQPSAAPYVQPRRHSFSSRPQQHQIYAPAPDPWYHPQQYPNFYNHASGYPANYDSTPLRLHPLLDATYPSPTFLFNLNNPVFQPMHVLSPQSAVLLSPAELSSPASVPPMRRIKIFCEGLSWPIVLGFHGEEQGRNGVILPFSLGDVLLGIYSQLRVTISRSRDWETKTKGEQAEIAKAYYRRYNDIQRGTGKEGLLRIDFLKGRTWFRGLKRMGDSNDEFQMVLVDR